MAKIPSIRFGGPFLNKLGVALDCGPFDFPIVPLAGTKIVLSLHKRGGGRGNSNDPSDEKIVDAS
jgi:hypothetical protein